MDELVVAIKDLLLDIGEITGSKILVDVRDRVHHFQDAAGPIAQCHSLRIWTLIRVAGVRHEEQVANICEFENAARNLELQTIRILRLHEVTTNEVNRLVKVPEGFRLFDRVI